MAKKVPDPSTILARAEKLFDIEFQAMVNAHDEDGHVDMNADRGFSTSKVTALAMGIAELRDRQRSRALSQLAAIGTVRLDPDPKKPPKKRK